MSTFHLQTLENNDSGEVMYFFMNILNPLFFILSAMSRQLITQISLKLKFHHRKQSFSEFLSREFNYYLTKVFK